MLAFTVLAALFIVGIAFHQNAYNAVLQTHHFKIQEQALTMGDALSDIAKKIIEHRVRKMEDPFSEILFARLKKPGDKTGMLDVFSFSGGKMTGDLGDYASALMALSQSDDSGRIANPFEMKALAQIIKDKEFEGRGDFVQDAYEFKGTVRQVVEFRMAVRLFTDGGDEKTIWTNWQKLETQYELKRVRVQPQAVRHFSLFAQDVSGRSKDIPGDFRKGQFNNYYVRASGERARGTGSNTLLINSGATPLSDAICSGNSCDEKGDNNPFKTDVGYILAGTGNDDSKGVYLNLTAGNARTSETFHLFRGQAEEGDFYQLYTSDYASVLDTIDKISPSASRSTDDQIKSVKNLLEKELKQNVQPSSGLAYYYMARKDYGYAEEWANHPEFGFISKKANDPNAPGLPANSLHLFGEQLSDGGGSGFTVVFGNIYRRCLSLSGYKQVKQNAPKGTTQRSFEIQAGPIHFYKDFWSLSNRRMYIHEKAGPDMRSKEEFRPIEVWDSRMNWVWPDPKGGTPADAIRGSWVFVSGDGLMLRLISSIAGLYENDNGVLFDAAVGMSNQLYSKILEIADQSSGDPLVSPLLKSLYELEGNKWPTLFKTDGKRLVWENGVDDKYSAYVREILIQFYHNSWWACPDGNCSYSEEIKKAATMWTNIMQMVNDKDTEGYYAFNPVQADWIKTSRIYASPQAAPWATAADSGSASGGGSGTGSSAGGGDKLPLYFTLPDPWQVYHKAPGGTPEQNTAYADRSSLTSPSVQGSRLNKAISSFKGDGEGGPFLFENYFKPLMTDPGWILPYNYSARFGMPVFREMFFTAAPKDRMEKMRKEIIPEFRDSVGFHHDRVNKYMEARTDKEKNKPLNNEFQKKIIRQYKDENFKERDKAYFFVSELGSSSKSLEELDLALLYSGRCIFNYKPDEFLRTRRNSSGGYRVDSSICVDGNLEIDAESLAGPGILWVKGNFVHKARGGRLEADGVVIVASGFDFQRNAEIKAVLIQYQANPGFSFSSIARLDGALVTPKLDGLAITSVQPAELNYNAAFLKQADYTVGFQPYIKSWGMVSD